MTRLGQSSNDPKRILLIDDQEVVRIGLKKMLSDAFSGVVCGETGDTKEALQLAKENQWDLVILELSIDRKSGLDLLKQIKSALAKVPILVVTRYSEQQWAVRAIKAGAAGYVTKINKAAELLRAAKQVLQGGRYVSASLAETLSADLHRNTPEAIHELLSDRELQVMRLIGSGKTGGEIAALLCISDKTVSTYRARILDKTGMKTNAELIRYAVEQGFID